MFPVQIYEWCKEGLEAGKHVIRLKIGDPFVFGRGGEEVIKFREFGVEPKVIPVSCCASVSFNIINKILHQLIGHCQ